jgi:hypothetical protein
LSCRSSVGVGGGKMFHSGQPEFQNRNPDERAKVFETWALNI